MATKSLEDELYDDISRKYGECLTRREIERVLNVSHRMARKLIVDGDLESFRLGHHYRVPARSVARYAAMGTTPPKPKL